jgi:Spy/CpxP family protein refolding chaperone
MKKVFVGLLIVMFSMVFVAQADAQQKKQLWIDPVGTFRPPSPAEEQAIVTDLQLTEEQKSQMQDLNKRYKADVKALADKYQQARQDMISALESGDPDTAKVRSAAGAVNDTHSKLLAKEVEYWTAIPEILTQEQTIKFWKLFGKSRIKRGAQE